MTDRFLTDAEIETLTGRRQAAAQIRFLQRRQIHHIVNAAGRPVVAWTSVAGGEAPRARPNFAALRRTG